MRVNIGNALFQSTLPARGATPARRFRLHTPAISIHAPREGSDWFVSDVYCDSAISIHAPREGSDYHAAREALGLSNFNPRSPRGERPMRDTCKPRRWYFNPRSPRGERRRPACPRCGRCCISIHAPREGSDTLLDMCMHNRMSISIHAPREGSDVTAMQCIQIARNFNPRSPRGERQHI